MITCTTLNIMTPHVRHLPSVKHLIDHLEHIGYLERDRFGTIRPRPGAEFDGGQGVMHQGGRAHRIETDDHTAWIMMEDTLYEIGVPYSEYAEGVYQ